MASFVVMEPPADRGGEQARFIRDSFAFFAFLAPPVWFAWHRLWVEAAVALALVMGIGALGDVAGFGGAAAAVTFLVMLFAGFEARGLRIAGTHAGRRCRSRCQRRPGGQHLPLW